MVEYKYNAWGIQLSRTGELANTLGYANPFRYRGYIYDDETWMYWLRSRYYYPELHRFISADNVMDGAGLFSANLYAYCKNAPVGASDPSGHTAIGTLEGILSNPSIQEVLRNLTGIFDNAWTAIKMGLVAGATYIATRVIGANAEPRSESQLQEALLAGSATSASVRDHSYATDWYYFAFILSDPENHFGYLMHINVSLTMDEAKIVLATESVSKALMAKYGFKRHAFGIYTDTEGAAYALALATGGPADTEFHFYTNNNPGEYYYHYHAFGVSHGPHIWFGPCTIKY